MTDPTPSRKAAPLLRTTDLLEGTPVWQALLDQLDCGIAVYDAQRRLVACNQDFKRQYPPMAAQIEPGIGFEQLLRLALARGLVPQAAGQEEQWIETRLRDFGVAAAPIERHMPDGRWRRIVETRLPDGGVLSFSTDITELVHKRGALQQALDDTRLANERLEDAIEALPAGFELWDADDRLVLANTELGRQYPAIEPLLRPGVNFETLVRANHAAGALPIPAAELDAHVERRRAQRSTTQELAEHDTGDGRHIRVHHRLTRHGALVGVRVDVTELHRERAAADAARREAEAATHQLYDAIEALPDGFALYDADDRLAVCNARYRELYRESAPALVPGARFEDILRYGLAQGQYPQAGDDAPGWLAARLQRHRNPRSPEIQQLPGDRWLRIDERPTRDGGIAGVRSDVSELVRRERELSALNAQLAQAHAQVEALSETDALTGIANRRRFDRRLDEEWARVVRYGASLGLLIIDIDHFKRFNDRHGHMDGDACLCKVARLLATCSGRPTDVVARFGGEEFAILLPHVGRDDTRALAHRCVQVLDDARLAHGDSPLAAHVTVSVGAAWVQDLSSGAADALLRAADAALYRAKAAGRHRAEFDG